MLMAYEKGAALIVSVGAHFNLIEFLDRSREGMSSTFLTRLRIGETLVDAKGVSRLYNPGIGGRLFGALRPRLDRARRGRDPELRDAAGVRRPRLAEDPGLAGHLAFWDGLQLAIPRGLSGGGLPRPGDRHPDRGRFRRQRAHRAPSATSRPASPATSRRPAAAPMSSPPELDQSEEFAQRVYPTLVGDQLAGQEIGVLALGGLPDDLVRRDRDRAAADRRPPGVGRGGPRATRPRQPRRRASRTPGSPTSMRTATRWRRSGPGWGASSSLGGDAARPGPRAADVARQRPLRRPRRADRGPRAARPIWSRPTARRPGASSRACWTGSSPPERPRSASRPPTRTPPRSRSSPP